MRVAIIPARGGSKRIPRKNIRSFLGKPIIAYSIEAALASGLFKKVIVSTDDKEIARVAETFGADVPFFRDDTLAGDHATIMEVLMDAYQNLHDLYGNIESLCCIYATAPFVSVDALKRGVDTLENTDAAVALSVAKFNYPIQRALKIDAEGMLEMIDKQHLTTRSQDLPEAYMDAAQFICCKATLFKSGSTSLFDLGMAPVVLPTSDVQDIDTLEDWERAEAIFQYLKSKREVRT